MTFANLPVCVCMCSWGSGADLWGSEVDGRFGKPSINDGLLEVVGVTGVVHMVRQVIYFPRYKHTFIMKTEYDDRDAQICHIQTY